MRTLTWFQPENIVVSCHRPIKLHPEMSFSPCLKVKIIERTARKIMLMESILLNGTKIFSHPPF